MECTTPVVTCLKGQVWSTTMPATVAAISNPASYQTTPLPTDDNTPWTPLSVSVGQYADGLRLVEMTDITGTYRIFTAPKAGAPWHLARTGTLPGCPSTTGFCIALEGHPELSTATRTFVSYKNPDVLPGGHVVDQLAADVARRRSVQASIADPAATVRRRRRGMHRIPPKVVAGAFAALLLAAVAAPSAAAAAKPYPVPYTFSANVVAGAAQPGKPPPGANDWSCRPTAAHPRPVVLVHGLFANMTDNWQTMSPLLANNGYCVFALTYGRRLRSRRRPPPSSAGSRRWSRARRSCRRSSTGCSPPPAHAQGRHRRPLRRRHDARLLHRVPRRRGEGRALRRRLRREARHDAARRRHVRRRVRVAVPRRAGPDGGARAARATSSSSAPTTSTRSRRARPSPA